METTVRKPITVETTINASIDKVWNSWTKPEHIMKWCQASEDWHVPAATNDLRIGGKFVTTMAAKDGSVSFDFGGEYTDIQTNSFIAYTIGDGRKVEIEFTTDGNTTRVKETFDPESINSLEMQQAGWQAILDNFRTYTESI